MLLKRFTPISKTALLLFLGLSASYIALAPGTTDGRGYVPDDLNAGIGILASFNAWVKGRPVPPIVWTRHGPLPLLFDLPFIKFGKLFVTPDFVLSLQPILLTAAMLTVLYVWLRRLSTPATSLLLTMIGAFGTMLWPYAYIGLETKQSLFVLVAGYLALARGKIRSWPQLILFGAACGLAISVKSTGIVLAPAIAYLVYVQLRSDWRSSWKRSMTVVLIIAGIWGISSVGWNIYWSPKGGGASILLDQWTIDSPFQLFTNVIGLFGSPNKGFFIFAPVLLFCLYAVPRAFRTHPETAVFALLVTACTAALLSILVVVADELWGPRFMHVAVAPLLVVVGAACPRPQWRTLTCLVLLGVVGLGISFLGAFYYYGGVSGAAYQAGQNTLEWLAGDTVWNEVQFDARLFGVWWKGGTDPVLWTPSHWWAWTPPPDVPSWKTVNLRDYADPQSFLLYYWNRPMKKIEQPIFTVCWISLLAGPLLLAWVIARTIKTSKRNGSV